MNLKPLVRGYLSANSKGTRRVFVAKNAQVTVIPVRIHDVYDISIVGDGSSVH